MVRAPAAYKKQLLGPHEDWEWGVVQQRCYSRKFTSLTEEYTSIQNACLLFAFIKFHMHIPLYVKIAT